MKKQLFLLIGLLVFLAPGLALAAAKPVPKPKIEKPADAPAEEPLPVQDTAEDKELPPYPSKALVAIGEMTTYKTGEEDTFLDISRHFGLGYVELRAANPRIDPWATTPETELTIPGFQLLPRAPQEGIVVNLAKMRLYYFKDAGKPPLTYAIGIGREGLQTPTGTTQIVRKAAGPSWHPTDRMREAKPWLPASVPAGASNPLGTHAMYLGWKTFLIHGSNKPWGIGRRVSSGCMRMYPEDIKALFKMIPVGTAVTVVDQPILVGWLDDGLYLEANPSQSQSEDMEIDGEIPDKPMTEAIRKSILAAAGEARIDWSSVEKVIRERRGYPVKIVAAPQAAKK